MPQATDSRSRVGQRANLPDLLEAVAVEFGVSAKAIQSLSKDQVSTVPRHVLIWLARQEGYPMKACAMVAGCNNHTSATYAVKRMKALFRADPALQTRCWSLLNRVRDGEIERVRTMRERTEGWLNRGGCCPLCGKS